MAAAGHCRKRAGQHPVGSLTCRFASFQPPMFSPNQPPDLAILPEDLARKIQARRDLLRETLASWPRQLPWTLELGCGHGHYLTAYAEAHPETFCIGVDLITQRIQKAQAKADKRSLANLVFIKAEAREFLQALPAEPWLCRTFMLFPDPWPKKRHHKNRMLQDSLLEIIARKSLPGAEFCFRTDHAGLFDWAQEHLHRSPWWTPTPEAPWPLEQRSYFQDLMESWQSTIARRV